MNFTKKRLSAILIISLIVCGLGIFVIYQMTITYNAHNTFDGYCQWRGLAVESQAGDYGYCKNLATGKEYKIVLFKGRWYLDGDLPCGFLCF